MPYALKQRGEKWVVVNKDTGKVKGTHDSKVEAMRQMRLLYGVAHGWRPTGKPAKK